MLFLLPTALLSFASQPGPNDCSVIQDTCDGCTETGPGDGFISFLNLEQFHSKWVTIQTTRPRDRTPPTLDPPERISPYSVLVGLLCMSARKTPIPNPTQVHEWRLRHRG